MLDRTDMREDVKVTVIQEIVFECKMSPKYSSRISQVDGEEGGGVSRKGEEGRGKERRGEWRRGEESASEQLPL